MICLKSVLLFVCLNFIHLLPAQDPPKVDSLKRLLTGENDLQNTEWLLAIAQEYSWKFLVDSCAVYAKKGMLVAEAIGDLRNLAFGEYMTGRSLVRVNPGESLEWYHKALDKYEKLRDWKGQAWVYTELGGLARLEGKYDEAIRYFKDAAEFVEKQNREAPFDEYITYLAKLNLNIGLTYENKGEYEPALAYLFKSGELAEQDRDKELQLSILINQGLVYRHLNKPEKVQEYYRKGLAIAEETGNKKLIGTCLSNLGNTFAEEGRHDEALNYFQKALEMAKEAKDYAALSNRMINIGLIHLLKGEAEAAINTLLQAVATSRQTGIKNSEVVALNNLGEAYRKNQNYDKALEHAKASLTLSKEIGRKETIKKAYHNLYEIYRDIGKYELALENYQAYVAVKDTMLNEQNLERIEELNTRYETAKKEREIAALNQQSELQKMKLRQTKILMVLSGLLILLVALALYFFYHKKRLEEKQKLQESRQKQLQAQINPHFLFNALASIQNYMYESRDNDKAALYLTKFSKLMRQILENSREDFITLDQEIRTLKNYLDLQKVRFNDGFDYDIYTDPRLDLEETLLPPMMAQPFIENALEHGRIHKVDNGKVMVRFEKNGNGLDMIIMDNGIGRLKALEAKREHFDRNTAEKPHRSLAVKITRDRLRLLRKKQKKEVDLEITDLNNGHTGASGTKIKLQLPLIAFN